MWRKDTASLESLKSARTRVPPCFHYQRQRLATQQRHGRWSGRSVTVAGVDGVVKGHELSRALAPFLSARQVCDRADGVEEGHHVSRMDMEEHGRAFAVVLEMGTCDDGSWEYGPRRGGKQAPFAAGRGTVCLAGALALSEPERQRGKLHHYFAAPSAAGGPPGDVAQFPSGERGDGPSPVPCS